MNKKKKMTVWVLIGFLGITIFCVAFGVYLYGVTENIFYEKTAQLIASGIKMHPDIEQTLVSSLKERNPKEIDRGKEILERYGYGEAFSDLLYNNHSLSKVMISIVGFITLLFFCFGGSLLWLSTTKRERIDNLADYLYRINEGDYTTLSKTNEDEFSILEDELYKTVVMLREGQEKATKEKENLADNLADISHQLKTPLTSISLMVELLEDSSIKGDEALYIEKISAQIDRLNYLVSALLTLSKLDAGTLILENKSINVYEMLSSAIDPLVLMIEKRHQHLYIKDNTNVTYMGDFYWSTEAILNIVKNCSEHTPQGGKISITYEQNPIYTQIIIEDNGEGFAKKDIPHLFTRFYKGENAAKDSVGIGLALAKSIIRKQNGEIRAENIRGGGARFIIKFYSR